MSNCYVNDFSTTVKTYYKDISKCQPLTKEEEKILMHKAKNNDLNARNKILSSNLKFVFSVAKKYKGRGVAMDDLISEGNMGLLHAYDKFQEEKNVKFFSYAVWWINWYIQDFIKRRNILDEREVSDDDLMSSSFKTHGSEDDEVLKTTDVIMSDADDTRENEEIMNQKEIISKLINKLDARERLIIESYFGLKTGKPMNLEECGKMLGLSKERCRQIKVKSLLKMRSEMLLLN